MSQNQQIKTRFCPSPTGELHIGSARTALFNWLWARKCRGRFVLRIEDTDLARSQEAYTQQIAHDLRWLGLDWDEGIEMGGEAAPYRQSQRQVIYDRYYKMLENKGWAYPCFCSEHDLEVARKSQLAAGKPPRYPGTCRNLTAEQVRVKLNQGLQPALRFKVPHGRAIVFHDLVHGRQRFQSEDIGDFIIRRADGTPPFMFSNAVDDALMGITHALRGDDHITNTPRQIMILEALELPEPYYGHIALILGAEGGPLSKRIGSLTMSNLREAGYLPNALLNYLGRLGHYYESDQWMPQEKLIDYFHTDQLNTAPAHFDEQQMRFWQRQAMHHSDPQQIWPVVEPYVLDRVPETSQWTFLRVVQPNIEFPQQAEHWAKIIFDEELDYKHDVLAILQSVDSAFFVEALRAVQTYGLDYDAWVNHLKQACGVKGKQLFKPLRAALTGELEGPELKNMVKLLGQSKVEGRLQVARETVAATDDYNSSGEK